MSKYVDINLISKRKKGFAIPLHRWLSNELNEWSNDLFNSKLLKDDEFLKQDEVLKIWQISKTEIKITLFYYGA